VTSAVASAAPDALSIVLIAMTATRAGSTPAKKSGSGRVQSQPPDQRHSIRSILASPWTENPRDRKCCQNDRLLNNPVPPRELDPAITPQLQEIILSRSRTAREFARDLENQSQVGVADRPELADWKAR
jgi:hypothetical protein